MGDNISTSTPGTCASIRHGMWIFQKGTRDFALLQMERRTYMLDVIRGPSFPLGYLTPELDILVK